MLIVQQLLEPTDNKQTNHPRKGRGHGHVNFREGVTIIPLVQQLTGFRRTHYFLSESDRTTTLAACVIIHNPFHKGFVIISQRIRSHVTDILPEYCWYYIMNASNFHAHLMQQGASRPLGDAGCRRRYHFRSNLLPSTAL